MLVHFFRDQSRDQSPVLPQPPSWVGANRSVNTIREPPRQISFGIGRSKAGHVAPRAVLRHKVNLVTLYADVDVSGAPHPIHRNPKFKIQQVAPKNSHSLTHADCLSRSGISTVGEKGESAMCSCSCSRAHQSPFPPQLCLDTAPRPARALSTSPAKHTNARTAQRSTAVSPVQACECGGPFDLAI